MKFISRAAVIVLVLHLVVPQVHGSSSMNCPPSGQVTSCSPKCLQDTECSSMGGMCCPNLCNYKSCVIPKNNNPNSNKKTGVSGNSGTGSYCGNMKCSAFQKCDMDKVTRKFTCVRA